MKKVQLIKLQQHDEIFYFGKLDPRLVIKLALLSEQSSKQEAQRPWNEAKVKEVAKYVNRENVINLDTDKKSIGLLPNCPVINLKTPFVIKDNESESYLEMPESDSELDEYKNTIEILDGQHRLISFRTDYIKLDINSPYEMGFMIFKDLSHKQKLEIFVTVNDKQTKIETNVLHYMKKSLGLLDNEDDILYDIISSLNTEDISPLKNRIMIEGDKVTGGIKLDQLSKVLQTSKALSTLETEKHDPDKIFRVYATYLRAWNSITARSIETHKSQLGKISGIRYIFNLFPTVFEICKNQRIKFIDDEIVKIIEKLVDSYGGLSNYLKNEGEYFKSESNTRALSSMHSLQLKNIYSEGYNPLSDF